MAFNVSKSLSARCVFMAHIREGRYHDGTFLGKSESWLPPLPVPSPPLLSLSARLRCSSPFPIYLLADKDRLAKSIGRNPPPAFATLARRTGRGGTTTTGRTDGQA